MDPSFGAGRFWGDGGQSGTPAPVWDPWPLAELWSNRPAQPTPTVGAPHENDQEDAPGATWAQEDRPRPSESEEKENARQSLKKATREDADPWPRARVDTGRVHRLVSHIEREAAERGACRDVGRAADLWANWAPGRAELEGAAVRSDPRERDRDSRGYRDHRDRPHRDDGHHHDDRRERRDAREGGRVRLGKDLAESWSTREVLRASERNLEEFDTVHAVVALHRIAKSTDYGNALKEPPLVSQLARLAKKAALNVAPSQQEVPHVKEVSKALWALAKVGPWADSMEGTRLPENAERSWSSAQRSLQALGSTALGRLSELDSHGLSNVAWSLAISRAKGAEQLAASALEIFPDFQAQGLANTAWAMARLLADVEGRGPERRLLECIAKEVGRRASDFTPQGLANIGWAFATLVLRQDLLMNAIAQELADGVTGWSQQNLANILWAFAKVAAQPPARAAQAVAEDALHSMQAWSALNIANLSWAFAKLQLRHPRLFDAAEQECEQKLRHFSPQNLVNMAWAFAKVSLARRRFFELLGRRGAELAGDFNGQNCSNAVWAFASVSFVSQELLDATSRRAVHLAPDLCAQDLANLSWAFAKLSRRDGALEETIASQVVQKVHSFSPQHLSIIVYSFAQMLAAGLPQSMPRTIAEDPRLRHLSSIPAAPSANSMVEVILTAALQRVREFDAQGLTNLAQSLAKLEMIKDNLLEALVEEAGPKVKTFTNQELAMLAWACARLGRFRSSVLRLVAKETKARLAELTAQDLSVLVWSFARGEDEEATPAPGRKQDKGRKDAALGAAMLNTLGSTVMRLIHELTPQDLSTIVWGYATAGVECPDLIEAVADEAVGKVASFAPQDMANVTWGLAKMGLLHEELLEVLSRDFVARASEFQAQHLSIAAWSFAKLGASAPQLFRALGKALAQRAEELDPQGVGNSLWAFGVLCFWHHPFVQAVGGRAVADASELTVQEIANVAFGLRTLLSWRRQSKDPSAQAEADDLAKLLMDFLAASGGFFCRKASGDGASWTDFANVAAAAAKEEEGLVAPVLKELEARFRRLHLEPLVEGLQETLQSSKGLQKLQEVLDEASDSSACGGVPHLGEFYSAEVLDRLQLSPKPEDFKQWFPGEEVVPTWIEEARNLCRDGAVWQIPATDTVVAHVRWDVCYMENTWRNDGRVYHAASLRAQARGEQLPQLKKETEELLPALRQHLRRDMHPERLALLELLEHLRAEEGEDEERLLQRCEGRVQVYVSQYPCVSCLAVFCQFRRRCPNIQLEVAFDNAWTTFCGQPRNR